MIAFNKLKQALINAPIIKPPNYDKHFDLICKASYDAIGVTLGQYDGTIFNVIHYASKTLNDAQKRYPHIEKELFAIVYGCDKFRSYISESKVRVHTDRDGIKEIISRKDVNPRLIRWILLLQEFELQMIQRTISKEEEDPGAIQNESINEKSENIHIYIPPGTVHSERPLTHFICNSFTCLVNSARTKETNNIKLGDVTRLPDGSF